MDAHAFQGNWSSRKAYGCWGVAIFNWWFPNGSQWKFRVAMILWWFCICLFWYDLYCFRRNITFAFEFVMVASIEYSCAMLLLILWTKYACALRLSKSCRPFHFGMGGMDVMFCLASLTCRAMIQCLRIPSVTVNIWCISMQLFLWQICTWKSIYFEGKTNQGVALQPLHLRF